MQLSLIVLGIGVIFTLIGIIFNLLIMARIQKLELSSTDHEKRIQKQENITDRDVQELKNEFKEFKNEMIQKFDALTNMVHKDKNMEGQLNQTLGLLLKELQKKHENA